MKWELTILIIIVTNLLIGNMAQRERDQQILQEIKDFRKDKSQDTEIIKDLQDRLKKAGLDSSIG